MTTPEPSPVKMTPARILSSKRESNASDNSGELPEAVDVSLPTYFEPGMFKNDDMSVVQTDFVGIEEVVIQEVVEEERDVEIPVTPPSLGTLDSALSTPAPLKKHHHHHHSKVREI